MKKAVSELSRHAAELEKQNRKKQLEIDRLKKQQQVRAACDKNQKAKNVAASSGSAISAAAAASASAPAVAPASAASSTLPPPLPKPDPPIAKVSPEDDKHEQLVRARNFAKEGSTFQSKLCRKRLGNMVLQNITLKLGETHLTVVPGSMLSYILPKTNYDLKTIFKVRGDAASFEVFFIDGITERFTPRQPVSSSDPKPTFTQFSSSERTELMSAVKDGVLTQEQVLDCARSALPVSVVLDRRETDVMSVWRKFLISRLLQLWGTENVDISLPNQDGLWEGTHLGLEVEAKKREAVRAARRDAAIEVGAKILVELLDIEVKWKDRNALMLQTSNLLPRVRGRVSASQWRDLQARVEEMRKDPNSFTIVQYKQLHAELKELCR